MGTKDAHGRRGEICTQPWFIALWFVMAAALVRIVYVVQLGRSPFFDPRAAGSDIGVFDAMARGLIARGWGHDGVFEFMPGFGYVLAAVYALSGERFVWAYALNIALGSLAVGLVYLYARRAAGGVAGAIAAFAACFAQPLIFHTGVLTGETAAVFLTVALLCMCSVAYERGHWWLFLAGGAIAGLGALFRGSFVLFLLAFLAWYAFAERRRFFPHAAARIAAAFIGCIIAIMPATVHNYRAGGDFVMIASHGGMSAYLGNNPEARGGFQPVESLGLAPAEMRANARSIAEDAAGRALKPSEISRYWRARAIGYVRGDPLGAARLAGEKALAFFNAREISDVLSFETIKEFSWIVRRGSIPPGVLVSLALVGMAVGLGRRPLMPLYLLVGANLVAVIVTFVNARYRLAAVPAFAVFAGIAIAWLWKHRRSPRLIAAWFAGLAAAAILVHLPIIRGENRAIALFRLAHAYQIAGDERAAEDAYRGTLVLDPQLSGARYNLALMLWEMRRTEEAKAECAALIDADPEHVDALNLMGNILLFRDDKKGALQYWERSLAIDEHQPAVRAAIEYNKLR